MIGLVSGFLVFRLLYRSWVHGRGVFISLLEDVEVCILMNDAECAPTPLKLLAEDASHLKTQVRSTARGGVRVRLEPKGTSQVAMHLTAGPRSLPRGQFAHHRVPVI